MDDSEKHFAVSRETIRLFLDHLFFLQLKVHSVFRFYPAWKHEKSLQFKNGEKLGVQSTTYVNFLAQFREGITDVFGETEISLRSFSKTIFNNPFKISAYYPHFGAELHFTMIQLFSKTKTTSRTQKPFKKVIVKVIKQTSLPWRSIWWHICCPFLFHRAFSSKNIARESQEFREKPFPVLPFH